MTSASSAGRPSTRQTIRASGTRAPAMPNKSDREVQRTGFQLRTRRHPCSTREGSTSPAPATTGYTAIVERGRVGVPLRLPQPEGSVARRCSLTPGSGVPRTGARAASALVGKRARPNTNCVTEDGRDGRSTRVDRATSRGDAWARAQAARGRARSSCSPARRRRHRWLPARPHAAPAPTTSANPAAAPAPAAAAAPSAGAAAVSITKFTFSPATITVAPGQPITWTNADPVAHTTTSNDKAWDSGGLQPGATFTTTLTQPGTYEYHCTIHPFIHGTVVVQG